MIFLLFLFFSFPSIFQFSSTLRIESSALGLRASSSNQLQSWLMTFYREPQHRHVFFEILQAKYFDYSPILLSICEKIDNESLYAIVSDLKLFQFPDKLIADCICVSAKNFKWKNRTLFGINPLISIKFRPQDWTIEEIREFLLQNLDSEIYWETTLMGSSEVISLYFESTAIWKNIFINSIPDYSSARHIILNVLNWIRNSNLTKKRTFYCVK